MFKALASMAQNLAIRQTMESSGLSFMSPRSPRRWWSMFQRSDRVQIGELNKSWDVYEAAQVMNASLAREDPILDMGAYGSEILLVLRAMGFTDLHGIDLNPNVQRMPFNDDIHYRTGDFYQTGYPDGFFSGINSISSIEHGCDIDRLLLEVARLLKPGGIFVASTDYYPDKIDTKGIRMFGLDWTIFCEQEMRALFDKAARLNLEPLGDCKFEARERPITCAGKDYTFALFALKKVRGLK